MSAIRKEMRTTRTVRRMEEGHEAKGSVPLGLPALLIIIGCGAAVTAMGLALVKVEFSARDYEIEARRVYAMRTGKRSDTHAASGVFVPVPRCRHHPRSDRFRRAASDMGPGEFAASSLP